MSFQQSPYAYVLKFNNQADLVFTWPNALRKYLRDSFGNADGTLALPPPDVAHIMRYRVNPKAGHAMQVQRIQLVKFMEG